MLVGGADKENNAYVEDMKDLGFKLSTCVDCSNNNVMQLKEEIYNSIYTYHGATDTYGNTGRASTDDMLNKQRDDKRGIIMLSNYRLCILSKVSSANRDLWCKLASDISREKYRQYILIATVPSKKKAGELPETWKDLFEMVSLHGNIGKMKSNQKTIINFDDIRLNITTTDKLNPKKAIINIQVSIDNAVFKELKLEDRIRPVLYLLAEAAKKGSRTVDNLVENKSLRNAYTQADEAKSKIVKAFKMYIGKERASQIIKIEHRIGKRLLIPKKNITITNTKSSS